MAGPLDGVRIVEVAALGPAPFGVMLLADLGADVVRVDRLPGQDMAQAAGVSPDALGRGRRSIAVDLKHADGVEVLTTLAAGADVLVEGFRPGVAERLGFGPDVCLAANPRLVYARMTGWGQDGPLADRAGHDIDYIAVAGALHPIGQPDRPPPPPLNLVADFGGGGTYLAIGVLAALLERERSGRGQVVDAAMVDGVASLTTAAHGLLAAGRWSTSRWSNLLDGAAPFYTTYATADGGHVAVGALEPKFHAQLIDRLGLDPEQFPQQDRASWPRQRERLAAVFAGRSRDEWAERFADSDACVTPVLRLDEAPRHPQLQARATFVERDGVSQPAPAPRLSRTPGVLDRPAPRVGEHTDEVLAAAGYGAGRVGDLRERGVIA